jgi:hypothetical protein
MDVGAPARACDDRHVEESVDKAAEIFAALTYFALGLSHIVQP